MRRIRKIEHICFGIFPVVLLLAFSLALAAQDQTTTSNLKGTITDSTKSVIPNARVLLTGTDNGVSRSVITDAVGNFAIRMLPPATYTLRVESKGFKVLTQQGIALLPGQTAEQDIELTIGTEQESVTVTSQAPLLNTSDANLSAEITAKQVVDLPLNLRNVYGLATLNSSVQNTSEGQKLFGGGTQGTADQDISFLNFGGGFFGTTAFLLDGIWDTASDWGAVVYVPSVEAVQEFKIQTNSFTAQTGFSTGNVINVVTKSGSSNFHGDAYEFLRNDKLDANSYFNNFYGNPKPSFRRNQFGFSAGGPLYIPKIYKQRQKTFIFGLYEGLRQSTPATFTATVPTAAFRTGDFSALLGSQVGTDALGRPILSGQLYNPASTRAVTAGTVDAKTGLVSTTTGYIRDPFVGNNIAGFINPVGAALAGYYPKPSNNALSNNYSASASAPAQANEYLIRVDHNLTDATRIYGRWGQKFEFKTNSPTFYGATNPGGPGNIRPNNRFSAVAGISHVFNPTTVASGNVGISRWAEGSNTQGYPFDQTKVGLPGSLNIASPIFPIINVEAEAPLGPVQGNQGVGFRNVGSLNADVTKTVGPHDLAVGFMAAIMQNNGNGLPTTQFSFDHGFTAGPDASKTTNNTGFGFASLLLGNANSGSTANNFNPAITKKYWGMYVQDDWKAAKTLTLNLGLRYEWQQPPTERTNRQAYFNYAASNPISSAVGMNLPGELVYASSGHRGIYSTTRTNFAPRIGFTDQLTTRMVLRGGYGIFFAPQYFGGGYNPGFSQTTSYTSSVDGGLTPFTSLTNPFPNGLITPTGRSLGALQDVGFGTTGVPTDRHSPYVQQYSMGLQYAFNNNDVLTVSYVGNHGTHMLASGFNRSQMNPSNLSQGDALLTKVANPFYGHITNSSCGLDQPTIVQGHLLQPYPQYCSVNEPQAPVGFSLYNALLTDYNHRFHGGLNLLVSYTYSKFLDNVGGTNDWSYVGNSNIRNYYNLGAEKSVDGADTPHSLVVNYIYELPVGRNRKFAPNINRATDAVIGGWQLSGIASYKSGIPLAFSGGGNSSTFGANQRPDQIANPKLSHRTIDKWFNTAAFAAPAPYTLGNTPRFLANLRAPSYTNWDASLQKFWTLHEEIRLQGRAEFFNIVNHPNFYAPDTNLGDGSFGTIRQSFAPRSIQFAMKLLW